MRLEQVPAMLGYPRAGQSDAQAESMAGVST